MRQIWITKAGEPDVLQVKEAPDPECGLGQVLIEVKSAGINFADIMARMGMDQDAPKPPCVVGYEIAGVVEKVGQNVSRFQPGDKVLAMTKFGGYSSKVSVDEIQAYSIPTDWSFDEAAGMPVNYISAYQLLIVMGSLREGNTVLIHSAGGGVGTAASQIAKMYNATILGTASPAKHNYIRSNGVEFPIDYRSKDYLSEVMKITNNKGVDIVIDPLGGKYWKKSYQALKPSGRLLMFGVSSMSGGKSKSLTRMLKTLFQMPLFLFHPLNLISNNKGVLGVNVGHLWNEWEMVVQWVRQLLEWAEAGKIRPHIDTVFSFDEAAEAHHYIQDRKNTGKVCLNP